MRLYKGSKYTIKVLLTKSFNVHLEDVAISFYTANPSNSVLVKDGIVVNGNIAEVFISPELFDNLADGLLMYTVYANNDGVGFMGERQSNYYLKTKSDGTPPQLIEITENGEHNFVLNNGTKVNIEVNVTDNNGSYAEGYEDGESKGFTNGYSSGKTEGYNIGYTAGETQGYSNGYTSGQTAGYLSGKTDGYSEGYAEGEVDGVKDFRETLPFLEITENGVYNTENKGVSVNVKTDAPVVGGKVQEQKQFEITENGSYSITPDDSYDSMGEVLVDVNVKGSSDLVLDTLGLFPTENGVYEYDAKEGAAWNKVYLNIKVPSVIEGGTLDYSKLQYNDDDIAQINSILQNNIDTTSGKYSNMIFAYKENYSNQTSLNAKYSNKSSLIYVPDNDTTTNVTYFSTMFSECRALQNAPMLDTSSAYDMSSMFLNCKSLKNVPLYNTYTCTNMDNMFDGCLYLNTVPAFNTYNVTTMTSMFMDCVNLKSLPEFNCTNVKANGMSLFLYGTSNFSTLTDLGGFKDLKANLDVSKVSNMNVQSALNILNGLYNFTGSGVTPESGMGELTLNSTQNSALPSQYKNIAINKGWVIKVA